ncbi:MAG: putative lipid II flippase FtsW [Methyloprofundus sp.]|nr:putative lipid II flippase FtsW [Methyloprofundus sp.]
MGGIVHFDKTLVFANISLLCIGYLMVCSASLHIGLTGMGSVFYYPVKQLIHIAMGLVAALAIYCVPMRLWEMYGTPLFFLGVACLVLVLIPGIGVEVKGSTRWIALPGFRFQVSEAVKLSVVIYMAGFVTRHKTLVADSAYGLIRPLFFLSTACGLLLMEPDMGSAVVIMVIAMGVMFLGGARLQQFILLVVGVVGVGALAITLSEYRQRRMNSFLHPWEDPWGDSYQVVQALIAFGRGEWLGVGLGAGVQKIFYLPEAHTDFLFSVLGEELGFIGVLAVIVLFAVIVLRAFVIGEMAEALDERFSAFIAYGLGIWFAFQSFINMGVNMGLLPTKGITLPFMSYGGSSMIIMCIAMALLYRVNTEIQQKQLSVQKDVDNG